MHDRGRRIVGIDKESFGEAYPSKHAAVGKSQDHMIWVLKSQFCSWCYSCTLVHECKPRFDWTCNTLCPVNKLRRNVPNTKFASWSRWWYTGRGGSEDDVIQGTRGLSFGTSFKVDRLETTNPRTGSEEVTIEKNEAVPINMRCYA